MMNSTPRSFSSRKVAWQSSVAKWKLPITPWAMNFERKVKEGRSKRDVVRLLKRYVAREIYHYLPRG
jgi:hypothetical protein